MTQSCEDFWETAEDISVTLARPPSLPPKYLLRVNESVIHTRSDTRMFIAQPSNRGMRGVNRWMGGVPSEVPREEVASAAESLTGGWWPPCRQFSPTLWRQVLLGCLCLRGTTSDANGLVLGQPSRGS